MENKANKIIQNHKFKVFLIIYHILVYCCTNKFFLDFERITGNCSIQNELNNIEKKKITEFRNSKIYFLVICCRLI